MNGPQHYMEAQRHLSRALHVITDSNAAPADAVMAELHLAAAQVHATLAHTAAFALQLGDADNEAARGEFPAWEQAVAPRPPAPPSFRPATGTRWRGESGVWTMRADGLMCLPNGDWATPRGAQVDDGPLIQVVEGGAA